LKRGFLDPGYKTKTPNTFPYDEIWTVDNYLNRDVKSLTEAEICLSLSKAAFKSFEYQ